VIDLGKEKSTEAPQQESVRQTWQRAALNDFRLTHHFPKENPAAVHEVAECGLGLAPSPQYT
jgi:hypothetical protein